MRTFAFLASVQAALFAVHRATTTSAWTTVIVPRSTEDTRRVAQHYQQQQRQSSRVVGIGTSAASSSTIFALRVTKNDDGNTNEKTGEDAFFSKGNMHRNYDDNDEEEDVSLYSFDDEPTEQQQHPPPNHDRNASRTQDSIIVSAALEKKIRVAKAQADIDRILSGPDPPFDLESELKKVISIAPLPRTAVTAAGEEDPSLATRPTAVSSSGSGSRGPSEAVPSASALEHDLLLVRQEEAVSAQLEAELYQAVKEQEYAVAARKRQSLNRLHMDDSLAVLQVNANFYRAFSQKDYRLMESLWLPDDTVTCIHPSHQPLIGAKVVCRAWERMFASSNGSFQRNWMDVANIRVSVKGGSTAILTCDELVYARRFVRGQKRQTELVNKLTATNIFRKVAGQWYLTHHHASWHADSEAAKQALQQRGSSTSSAALLANLQKRQDANEPKDIGMDGIMGMQNFGPLLGNGSNSGSDATRPPRQSRRIVMGSLSDIFNGGLEDLLSGKNKGSSNHNNNSADGSNGGAIIQFHRIEAETDDEDDDDDDEDNDDDDDDDEVVEEELELVDNDSSKEAVSIIKEWAESRGKQTSKHSKSAASSLQSTSSSSSSSSKELSLRQSCISTLRHLCVQGLISKKQKRVLLTDIISCSAKGEKSMVEVAYELLCATEDDKAGATDIAEEEFADQCRVFAESLSDSHVTRSL